MKRLIIFIFVTSFCNLVNAEDITVIQLHKSIDRILEENIQDSDLGQLEESPDINLEEIDEALKTIRRISDQDVLLFHCISSYPTPTSESNLSNIKFLKDNSDCGKSK